VADASCATHDPLHAVELVAVADEMASLLRHELRNKFAAVRNAEFYVRRRLRSTEAWQADPRIEELSAIIQSEMRVANELLDQRLRLQHLFAPAPSAVDAADCVRRAVACTRISGGCAVAINVDAEAGCVVADPNELALAVRCLVENAVEATGTSGAVHVRARPVDSHYLIEVVDAGAGIEEAQRAAVLEPYHTTKLGHVGLGLNISRRIAERYAGTLRFGEASAGAAAGLKLVLAVANA
jgi:signal transduction histidine kinase